LCFDVVVIDAVGKYVAATGDDFFPLSWWQSEVAEYYANLDECLIFG